MREQCTAKLFYRIYLHMSRQFLA